MPSGFKKNGEYSGRVFQKGIIPPNKGIIGSKSGNKNGMWKGGKIITKICPTCKKEFYVYPSLKRVIHCSRRCAKLGKKQSLESIEKRRIKTCGEKHYNFQGWRSREPYGKNWDDTLKESIRQRDNYKCQSCGCPQEECFERLTVHHIDKIKTNLNPDNLISLCRKCHGKIHFNKTTIKTREKS